MAGAAAASALRPGSAQAAEPTRPGRRTRTGVERLIATEYEALRGQRFGVITNPTGVLPDLRHEVDIMAGATDIRAVFGPEHGFRGTAQAGSSEAFFTDEQTGLPVYDTFEKTPDELAEIFTEADVDTIVFDIQDVGARFYTYIWTLTDSMQGAAKAGKRVVVLDRPNPITGLRASGPVLHPEYESTIGRAPIAQQHGMTVGELAVLFNQTFVPKPVDLAVIPMTGWRRDLEWEQTGLPWVPPSPNMPSTDTAFIYPGACLFSGTNLSQGRGTTRPFEFLGAPFMDHRWAEALTALHLPGLLFREAYFVPTFSTYVNEQCCGVQIVVTDRRRLDAVGLGVALLSTARRLYPGTQWLDVGEDGRHDYWLDHLTGTDWVRTAIDAGRDLAAIERGWSDDLRKWERIRRRFLRY
jgi:uncharacterized protein YbbC (DUF1343 family)